MIKMQFNYELLMPVTINQNQEITSVTVNAPTSIHRQHSAKLKQAILTAMMQAAKDAPKRENKIPDEQKEMTEEDGRNIVTALYGSKDCNIIDILNTFEKLVCSKNVCTLSNGHPMSEVVFSLLNEYDIDNMLGAYIANFIATSR